MIQIGNNRKGFCTGNHNITPILFSSKASTDKKASTKIELTYGRKYYGYSSINKPHRSIVNDV